MKTLLRTLPALVALLMIVPACSGQRQSPHETVTGNVGDATVTITYGRPYKKGRDVFGGLEPWDKVWRTGADEATTFATDKDVKVGTLDVPAGTYGLFTLPSQSGWKLILNKTSKQWGAFKYDAAMDLVRTDMTVSTSNPVTEQFTISLDGGTLKLAWDKTVAEVSMTAK